MIILDVVIRGGLNGDAGFHGLGNISLNAVSQ